MIKGVDRFRVLLCSVAVLFFFGAAAMSPVYAADLYQNGDYHFFLDSDREEFGHLILYQYSSTEDPVLVFQRVILYTDFGGKAPLDQYEVSGSSGLHLLPIGDSGAWGTTRSNCYDDDEEEECNAYYMGQELNGGDLAIFIEGRFTSLDTTTVRGTVFLFDDYQSKDVIWRHSFAGTAKIAYSLVVTSYLGNEFVEDSAMVSFDPEPFRLAKTGPYESMPSYFYKGDTVSVTAIPKDGYIFDYFLDYWTSPFPQITDNPMTVTMDHRQEFTAYFIEADLGVFAADCNPDNSVPASFSEGPVSVSHIEVKNNSDAAARVSSMNYTYTGEGSASDITTASLYRDSTCSGTAETLLGQTSINSGSMAFSNLAEDIDTGTSSCYLLQYTFSPLAVAKINARRCGSAAHGLTSQTVCPCADYGAIIAPEDITATLGSVSEEVKGATITGTVNAGFPEVVIEGEQTIIAEQKETLESFTVQMNDVHTTCYSNWKARFTVCKAPGGATGYRFDSGGQEILVAFDAMGKAEATFTTGDKGGEYQICVVPEHVDGYAYTCPQETSDNLTYSVYVGGIELVAQYDGNTEDTAVRTFVSNIEVQNKLIAKPQMAPEDPRTIKKITFSLDGTSREDSSEPFETTFDMQTVTESSSLRLTAELSDGNTLEEEYAFYAIPFPGWLNTVKDMQTYLDWGFKDTDEHYYVSFAYPGDFIWESIIPSDIPLLGGEENEAAMSCAIEGTYSIQQESGLTGEGEVATEILGHEFEARGTVAAEFDQEFNLKPGATATFEGQITFVIPEKTLASRTILVYGVPITLAIDLGGNVLVFVGGNAVLDAEFAFDSMTFVPGTTITLDVTASASAVFGAATIGVRGSPTGTIKIQISYTTADGITQDLFGGELEVELTVFGSLFWGSVSGDLGSTTLGPYTFGDDISSSRIPADYRRARQSSSGKQFYARTSVATDAGGRQIAVYTTDTSSSATAVNPEIACTINTGSGWSAETMITSNSLWELDPVVTFLSGGTALALWTSNDGAQSLSQLHEILAHQDIAYSYYNGSTWSAEAPVIDDAASDGSVDVAYDSSANTAMAVWFHNADTGSDIMDRSGWSVYAAKFDASGQTWSTPEAVAGTDDTRADFMPAVAADGSGNYVCFWISDADGELFTALDAVTDGSNADTTNKDCDIYYSVYDGSDWSSSRAFTSSNDYTELMVDAAATGTGQIAVVWVERVGTQDDLYLATYTPGSDTVGTPVMLDTGAYLIEDPRISVVGTTAKVVYRKHNGADDELYMISADLSQLGSSKRLESTLTAAPQQLTHNGGNSMWLSASVSSSGDVLTGWSSAQTASSGDAALAVVGATPGAALAEQYTEQAAVFDNATYAGLDIGVGVQVSRAGSYAVAAVLTDNGTSVIARARSDSQTLAIGSQTVTVSFSGREISASGTNGPYRVADIVLLDTGLSPVEIDRDETGFETAAYTADQFIPSRLTTDKKVYSTTSSTMKISVADENASGSVSVFVESSSADSPLSVTLTETDSGTFEGSLGFATGLGGSNTIKVADGATLMLTYLDGSGKQWNAVAGWKENADDYYTLTIAIDPPGSGSVTAEGIACPENCSETYAAGELVTMQAVAADGYVFSGWDNASCTGALNCTFTMEGDVVVTAQFALSDNGTGLCPAAAVASDNSMLMQNLYFIRDFMLAGDEQGTQWVAEYYQHAAGMAKLLRKNPLLQQKARSLLLHLLPVFKNIRAGKPVMLAKPAYHEGLSLLNDMIPLADKSTRRYLESLRRDIRNGALFDMLGISQP